MRTLLKLTIAVDDFSGGAGKIAQLLALEAAKTGHAVTLLLARRQTEPRFDLSSLTIKDMIPGKPVTEKNIPQSVLAVRRYLRSERPDLFVSFIHNINIIAGLAHIGFQNPLIVSERGDPIRVQLSRIWRFLRFFAYRRTNKIIVLFDAFHDFAAGRYREKTITIHNPVIQPPCQKEYRLADAEKGTITFITMTRLSKNKRLDLLLDMFAQVHAQYNHTKLKILGDGKEISNLIAKVEQLKLQDAVDLAGSTREIYPELCAADIYLMTSRHEGFPNALVEALSVGLPCLAFHCHDGLAEIIKHEENGFLIQEGNVQGYIKAMELILADSELYNKMSGQARQISQQFSFAKFYAAWNQVFADVLQVQQPGETG